MDSINEKFERALLLSSQRKLSVTEEKDIGRLRERTLHSVLKYFYEEDERYHEINVGRFVADIFKDGEIIEIQTRNFSSCKDKLELFLKSFKVTMVFPVDKLKWVSWINPEDGSVSKKHRSPKIGGIFDAFDELIYIMKYLSHPNFHLRIVLMEIEEYRYLNGWSRNKKRGSVRANRVPVRIFEEIGFDCTEDYAEFVPLALDGRFTVKNYAEAAGVSEKHAQRALKVLLVLGVVERTEKRGNAYLYNLV